MVVLLIGHTEVHCRKHCEDISLKESYQDFQQIKYKCKERECDTSYYILEDVDHRNQRHYYNVSRRHVGEETDKQCKWLNEHTDYFNRHHNDLHRPWQSRHPENVLPVISVGCKLRKKEGNNSKRCCNSKVSGYVNTKRHQT